MSISSGSLRSASLVTLVSVLTILWYRHLTWAFIEPWHQTNVNLPLLPVIAVFLGTSWLFFNQDDLSAMLRTRVLNLVDRFGVYAVVTLSFLVWLTIAIVFSAPPTRWKDFVELELIDGHEDQYYLSRNSVESLKLRNPELGLAMETAIRLEEILGEESKWVESAKNEELYTLQRRVARMRNDSEMVTVLSLLSGANLALIEMDLNRGNVTAASREKALHALQSLVSSRSRFATKRLKDVARKRLANTHFFLGQVELAVKQWELLPQDASVLANLVVGYRVLGDYKRSLSSGRTGLELVRREPSSASSFKAALVANTMTTHFWLGDYAAAAQLYEHWYSDQAEIADPALLQTYAIALVLGGSKEQLAKLNLKGRLEDSRFQEISILWLLMDSDLEGALQVAKSRAPEATNSCDVWSGLKADYSAAGYLGAPRVRDVFERALSNCELADSKALRTER